MPYQVQTVLKPKEIAGKGLVPSQILGLFKLINSDCKKATVTSKRINCWIPQRLNNLGLCDCSSSDLQFMTASKVCKLCQQQIEKLLQLLSVWQGWNPKMNCKKINDRTIHHSSTAAVYSFPWVLFLSQAAAANFLRAPPKFPLHKWRFVMVFTLNILHILLSRLVFNFYF